MPPKKSNSAKVADFLKVFLSPRAKKAWVEGDSSLVLNEAHREAHANNPLLNLWFKNIYDLHGQWFFNADHGLTLEIGSGGSNMKKQQPRLITSDVLPLPGVDRVIDAQKISFDDKSLSNITMINVLHHVPKPLDFFAEADRVLIDGGRLVMTEPFVSPLSYPIYKFVHHEPCELKRHVLELPPGGDAIFDSNQAMPSQLLRHHRDKIAAVAPHLKLIKVTRHSALSYFLTGGVNYSSPLPIWSWKILRSLDDALCRALGPLVASFFTVVFEKTPMYPQKSQVRQ